MRSAVLIWSAALTWSAVLILATPALTAQETLSLRTAIDLALRGPAGEIASAQIEEVRGGVRQAGLGLNPRLFLQSEDLRPWADNFSFPTQTEDYGYLSQTFEVDGKRSKRVAVARARLQGAEAARELQLRQVAGRVTAAYWNAVGSGKIATLLVQDMGAVEEMVRYDQARVDAGAMRGVDLLRMQLERDRLQIALATAQRDAAQARLELFRQMAQPVTNAMLSDAIEVAPAIVPIEMNAALAQRPDVQVAQEAVAAARADLSLQRANGVPDPDLLGGYKRNSGNNTIYAALQIPLPIRNRNQGEVDRARAAVMAAEISLSLLETQVRIEVAQAQQSYELQEKIVRETLPDMRDRAKRNLQIISEAYRIGGVDLLRFIDAERTAFEVEVSAVQIQAQLQQSAVQLQLAYGVQP